eukprot:548708_1
MAAKVQNRPTHKGFQQGDLAVHKGKLCVISYINWRPIPPDVTVRISGEEIDTDLSRLSRPTAHDKRLFAYLTQRAQKKKSAKETMFGLVYTHGKSAKETRIHTKPSVKETRICRSLERAQKKQEFAMKCLSLSSQLSTEEQHFSNTILKINKPCKMSREISKLEVQTAKNHTPKRHVLTVSGFIRVILINSVNHTPSDVFGVVLLFYAKQITMNIKFDNRVKYILFDPVDDEWNSDVCRKILSAFALHAPYWKLRCLQYPHGRVTRTNFDDCRWDENEIFEADLHNSWVAKICDAIGRYYKSIDKEYNYQFMTYCEENGMEDEDDMRDEMENSPEDCMLIEFDEDFPFENQSEDRADFIHKLIKMCMENPQVKFGCTLVPNFKIVGSELFKLEKYTLDTVRGIYRKQCPMLYTNDWAADECMLTILAVGRKYNFDYLLHLVDDFSRWRLKNEHKNDSELQWAAQHPHFNQLININTLCVPPVTYKELATEAVVAFRRVCPSLSLQSMFRIDDELDCIVRYIVDAINWVWSLVTTPRQTDESICPFQMDLCIAVGTPVSVEVSETVGSPRDRDEDEKGNDADDDDPKRWYNAVDDIKKNLDASNLKYYYKTKPQNTFADIYHGFASKHTLKGSYLHRKRLITMIDRRKCVPDDIWMYEAPDGRYIPKDAVGEWYIDSSFNWLGPSTETEGSFGAKSHCKAKTLTLSFHAKAQNVIKCYLFWNGEMMRFMADDIKTVLPCLFNPQRQTNRNEEEEKALDALIKDLEGKLVDEEFDEFVASYRH